MEGSNDRHPGYSEEGAALDDIRDEKVNERRISVTATDCRVQRERSKFSRVSGQAVKKRTSEIKFRAARGIELNFPHCVAKCQTLFSRCFFVGERKQTGQISLYSALESRKKPDCFNPSM